MDRYTSVISQTAGIGCCEIVSSDCGPHLTSHSMEPWSPPSQDLRPHRCCEQNKMTISTLKFGEVCYAVAVTGEIPESPLLLEVSSNDNW